NPFDPVKGLLFPFLGLEIFNIPRRIIAHHIVQVVPEVLQGIDLPVELVLGPGIKGITFPDHHKPQEKKICFGVSIRSRWTHNFRKVSWTKGSTATLSLIRSLPIQKMLLLCWAWISAKAVGQPFFNRSNC